MCISVSIAFIEVERKIDGRRKAWRGSAHHSRCLQLYHRDSPQIFLQVHQVHEGYGLRLYVTLRYGRRNGTALGDVTLDLAMDTPNLNTLYYTTPHSTALHCTALHCTTQHYSAQHYTTPHHTTLHYTTPHHTTPHYTTPHSTPLHSTPLHHTALHFTLSLHTT